MSHIISAIDFSPISDCVIAESRALAISRQWNLTLMHVAAPNPDFVGYEAGPQSERDFRAHELREEHSKLQEIASDLRGDGIDARGVLVPGETVATILREAKRLETRCIVIGSHGHGAIYSALVGSVSAGVIAGATCPVLVVPRGSLQPATDDANR